MTNSYLAIIKKEFNASGGLEKVTHRIMDAFQKRGVSVSVFSSELYTPKGLFKVQKMKDFDRWATEATKPYPIVLSMDRCSRQTHHRAGNGVHAAYINLRAQTEGKLRFALNPLHRLHLALEKTTFESPETKVIIVNSQMVRNEILHYYKTDPTKIHVIHNGVEWHENEADFHRAAPSTSCFQFLFVGHNFKRKGLDTLLKALARLPSNDFHLSVVGHDKNIDWYQSLTRQLKLEKKVTFHGKTSALPFYLTSHVLVLPSLYDPFANVTVEALSLGLFVITTQRNGGHEILNSQTGMTLSNPHDIEELTTALKTIIHTPMNRELIRNSISHLDYSLQLPKICNLCLG